MPDILEIILNLPPEQAHTALNLLDPLERQILEILIKRKTALTTQQIIDALIEELTENIIQTLNEEDLIILPKNPELFKEDNAEITLFKNTFFPSKTTVKLSRLANAFQEYNNTIQKAKTKTDVTQAKKRFVSNFCEIPSFRRLENSILPELVAMNLVIEREPVGRKRAKKLYAANPTLLSALESPK